MQDGRHGSCCLPRARRKRLSKREASLAQPAVAQGTCLAFCAPLPSSITGPRSFCYKEVGARPSWRAIACQGSDPSGQGGGTGQWWLPPALCFWLSLPSWH